jgi:hypothetical protein
MRDNRQFKTNLVILEPVKTSGNQHCTPMGRLAALSLTFVLERQLQSRAISLHLAMFDGYVHLHNLSNAQVPDRTAGGFHRILGCILPRLRARSDKVHYLID